MTLAHTDSPLRRSEVSVFREPAAQNQTLIHNDDEEERQARRRTLLNSNADSTDASTLEQSETLKKCLQIYHENKICRDNVWSLSLIDTLSTLLDRHHKSLNNFTVAGSSLEASSKVYGLRVDSVHTDVMRMHAGLNARKYRENANDEDDDGVATGGEGNADPNSSAGTGVDPTQKETQKRKRPRRKAVSTVTKNPESNNARLDTVPMQDPVFGKLNSYVGSINASNRLMMNMLNTEDSELKLRMTHKFWEESAPVEDCDYTEPVSFANILEKELVPCERLCKIERYKNMLLRPTNSGYIISDTPENNADERDQDMPTFLDNNPNPENDMNDCNNELFNNGGDTSMAFDMHAECEPLPSLDAYAPILAVDEEDLDAYTADDFNAIEHCRGMRKTAVVIQDLRPIDSTSTLEYSYRPVEKISQFWAGPSHWRFRRTRHRSNIGPCNSQEIVTVETAKSRRQNALQTKRNKVPFTEPIHDALFIKLDSKYKSRKVNFQKKWDQKKLRLPTDLQLNADLLINRRFFAPAFVITPNISHVADEEEELNTAPVPMEDDHFMSCHNDDVDGNEIFNSMGGGDMPPMNENEVEMNLSIADDQGSQNNEQNFANDTVLEIGTDFEGAPRQVTKIIVPFAKRAKVVDMKTLKRTCSHVVAQQIKDCAINESQLPTHPIKKDEHYSKGLASFNEVCKRLPTLLTPTMAEGLTTSIALYSVLHLSNDFSYRLVPQDDLKDFTIRQVVD